jgi:hypothetical protein
MRFIRHSGISRGTVWDHELIYVRGTGSVVLLQKTASIKRVNMRFGRSHAYFTSVGNNGVTREGSIAVVCASFQVEINQLLARSDSALAESKLSFALFLFVCCYHDFQVENSV